jgi:hypothetical protein
MSLHRARLGALSTMITTGLVLGVAATASAKVTLKVSPTSPIVDDLVTVSWKTDRALKPGYHYRAVLITPPGDECSGLVYKDSKRHPAKGKSMSFRLSPQDDELNGGSEWCQGKASVTVSVVKNGASGGSLGNIIGMIEFRFRAKP